MMSFAEMEISVVAFDFDGVLADTFYGIHQATTDLMEEAGVSNPPDFVTFCSTFSLPHKPFYESYGIQCTAELEKRFAELLDDYEHLATPYPGMMEVVRMLKQHGIGTAVVSAAHYERVSQLLERFESRQYFGPIYADDSCKTANLVSCCRDLGCEPSSACYVGDRPSDMSDAIKAGLFPIGFAADYDFMHHPLKKAGAEVVVDTPEELREWLSLRISFRRPSVLVGK